MGEFKAKYLARIGLKGNFIMSKKIVEHYSILCRGIKTIVRAGEAGEGRGGPGRAGVVSKYHGAEGASLEGLKTDLPSKDTVMLVLRGSRPTF